MRPRRAARLAREMWRVVVDPALRPPRVLRRRFKRNLNELTEDAQSSLAVVIREALEFDAGRFRRNLGYQAETAATLERQLVAISALLEGEEQPALEPVPNPVDTAVEITEGEPDA